MNFIVFFISCGPLEIEMIFIFFKSFFSSSFTTEFNCPFPPSITSKSGKLYYYLLDFLVFFSQLLIKLNNHHSVLKLSSCFYNFSYLDHFRKTYTRRCNLIALIMTDIKSFNSFQDLINLIFL